MALTGVKRITEAGVMGEMLYRLQKMDNQWWAPITFRVDSTHPEGETHAWLGGMPDMKEETGSPSADELAAPSFYVKNREWECAVAIHKRLWDSGAGALIDARIGQGTSVALSHPGRLLQTLIDAGDSSVCYDGQNFFDTDHQEGESPTQSNKITVTVVSATSPTAAEAVKCVLQGIQAIQSFRDDKNIECGMDATDFKVFFPTAYTEVMMTALYAQLIAATTNALANGNVPLKITSQVLPRLTGNRIIVMRSRPTGEAGAFIFQVFDQTRPEILGRQSEHCIQTNHLLFKQSGRYNLGYGRWQDTCMVALST